MPASEKNWRDLKMMHFVFALSAFALLGTTLWMMAADHEDQWRVYQNAFAKIESDRLKGNKNKIEASDKYQADLLFLEQKQSEAKVEVSQHKEDVKKLEAEINVLQGNFARQDRETKFKKAEQGVYRAEFDIAVRDNAGEEALKEKQRIYDDSTALVDQLEAALQDTRRQLDEKQQELKLITKVKDEADAALTKFTTDVDRIRKARGKIDPDDPIARFKRWTMELPIIDGFNSPMKIQQDWIPGLRINYGGMGDVARFDRCRTCHLGIDRVEAGNLPTFPQDKYHQPFASHPRPDVYLTASSPHALSKFGCTVCHEGQGSGTSFSNASHEPNTPAQEHLWAHGSHPHDKEHEFKSLEFQENHHWEYPMFPKRFTESSCIKCHHNVVELGINPQFGATAPKVFEGYNIVRQFGCFGCHEINGFDGTRSIGPDLRLEPGTREEADKLAQDPSARPGTMRKVGPALTHIADKTTQDFTRYWTELPQRFRPTTRMPSFFKMLDADGKPVLDAEGNPVQLEGQQDKHALEITPLEIAAITHFLFDKSTPIEKLHPADGYQADAERGKRLFTQRGCLACHSHQDFPEIKSNFGPDLSRVHEKLKSGEDGKAWLYTWIREPERYHPRTKMPNLQLDVYKEAGATIDPAADIAAYLLAKGAKEFENPQWHEADLNKMAVLYLSKTLPKAQVDALMSDRLYPEKNVANVKGDEVELFTGDTGKKIDESMLLNYVGRRTISRYGCYGCHDIAGFEKARPIGVALQNWGRKDKTKLAFEHIIEFLDHHGEPDGSSTKHRAEEATRLELNHEFTNPAVEAREGSVAYFYEQVVHGTRPGFLWQKVRSPRSYDFEKVDTKGYDERLRMPKFPFTPQQIEAVATFILGLVAEPPSEKYLYLPPGPAKGRIEGEKLLTKYNCGGCHILELPKVRYAADPEALAASELQPSEYPEGLNLLLKLKPPRSGSTGKFHKAADGKQMPIVNFQGMLYAAPDPEADIEDQEYSFDLWETLQIGDKLIYPSSKMLVPAKFLLGITSSRGGSFAEWLVNSTMQSNKEVNRNLAWQMSPPPLYREGVKVQTPWLYNFLRNPYQLRHTTLLRMPRFNMSDAEAATLANYFSAVDGSEYPYQDIAVKEPAYLAAKNSLHPHYLSDSWKLLNAPVCIKCHSLGGRQYQSSDPKTDIRGPNLESVPDRLRPEWTLLWLMKPQWVTPYTSMPTAFPRNQKNFENLFSGDGELQTTAIRDALMNYHRLMESEGKVVTDAGSTAQAGASQ